MPPRCKTWGGVEVFRGEVCGWLLVTKDGMAWEAPAISRRRPSLDEAWALTKPEELVNTNTALMKNRAIGAAVRSKSLIAQLKYLKMSKGRGHNLPYDAYSTPDWDKSDGAGLRRILRAVDTVHAIRLR